MTFRTGFATVLPMAQPMISKKTMYELQEFLVSYTLRDIEILYDSADIPCDENFQPQTSGQRRSKVAQYHHALDLAKADHVRKVLKVFESVLSKLDEDLTNANLPTWLPVPQLQRTFDN